MPKPKSVRVEFDLTAVQGLVETLKGINATVQAEVLADMVKEGAKPVLREIKKLVPVGTGNLKKSLVAVVRKSKKRGTAVAVIGPSTERFHMGAKVHAESGLTGLGTGDQPSRYAHLMENGFIKRNGEQYPARPFMRPGTEQAKANASAAMLVGFQKGMNRAVAKHVKRISKN